MTTVSRFPAVAAMDPLAQALIAHHASGREQKIQFRRDDGIWYDQSTLEYFAVPDGLQDVEAAALEMAISPVLDAGAATGRQCLELERRGHTCTAIDIHPGLVRLMRERGVRNPRIADIRALGFGSFATIYFLMDTIGIAGSLVGLQELLRQLKSRVLPDGQIIINAEPVLMDDDEDVAALLASENIYPGELSMQMRFRERIGQPFPWLYIDAERLLTETRSAGWNTEIILQHEETGHYLARLTHV